MWASLAVARGLMCCRSQALEHRLGSSVHPVLLLQGPGDLPRQGTKPESPALAGGFFTTGPPGKPRSPSLPEVPSPLLGCLPPQTCCSPSRRSGQLSPEWCLSPAEGCAFLQKPWLPQPHVYKQHIPDIYCGRLVDFRPQAESVSPSSPFLFPLSAAQEKFPVRKLQQKLPRQTLDCSVVLSRIAEASLDTLLYARHQDYKDK